jgi:hypothetical protein
MRGVEEHDVRALLAAAGLGEPRSLTPLSGGANNRVYRVGVDAGAALLKYYFRHPEDPRDRLGAEFAFARFAWDGGVRALPRPLACDAAAGLGLFEFVAGRPLLPEEVDDWAVGQALDFTGDLNRARLRASARSLPKASEACFSLEDHFALVARRVERLQTIAVTGDVDAEAEAFARTELAAAWPDVLGAARAHARACRLPAEPLDPSEWCVSPSDFGYHNAILAADGRLRFIDFEYAGRDDPAKLVCDFFCQPALPAPAAAFERFARAVAAAMPSPALHLERARLLLPVYRVKWCCIMLNEFLAVGGSRRAFSGSAAEQAERKARQLAKARRAFAALQTPPPNRKVA